MNDGRRPHLLVFESRQRNWLERVLYTLGGVAVIVIGFFFLTVALIAYTLRSATLASTLASRFSSTAFQPITLVNSLRPFWPM